MRILAALTLLALVCCPTAMAQTHEVKMLNRGIAGSMIYEPDFLHIAPGDTVKFIATHSSHNAASIPGLLPAGVPGFKGRINEQVELTLNTPGFYGIQCIPHLAMGMVMLIQVGDPVEHSPAIPTSLPARASERLNAIIGRELTR
ncbi:Pseudoazurin [Pseudomonas cichorii]|uniref:Pseudoazurin n=1 Tax=Pseudomonas cichorii TaxID=36746 RepID=A0A3M4MAG3_PSECI|nr:pseudoazurin [Pseudomonas cichorii]RMQ50898.1 Pseudoazurin [Pseudomonas cichorii]